MSIVPAINLQKLSFPELATSQPVDAIIQDLIARSGIESAEWRQDIDLNSPVLKALLHVIAKRERRLVAKINTATHAVMLATASGSNLDQIAALYGVKRLVLTPTAVEPEMEADDRLRLRARLAMEVLSQAGCEGMYLFHALSANGQIKDVSVFESNQTPGLVKVCLLSNQGRGGERDSDPLIRDAVQEALNEVRSVTDTIEIQWANVQLYHVKAQLTIAETAQADTVLRAVLDAVTGVIRENHRLGKHLIRDEFFSAMYQDGVTEVILDEPAIDLAIDLDTALYNPADPEDEDFPLQITIRELMR